MASLSFELALFVLCFSLKTETNGHIITVPVELHTTVDLPCSCPICPESTAVVQWYRSSSSSVFIKNGKALAWWSVGTTGSSQGFGIKDDFSMIIYNLTDQHDQDLYRCIVIQFGDAAECTHDVKLGIFANPETSPVIEYIRLTNGFNVTCSISHVFPMTFPILTTNGENGTAYINRDKTYNSDGTFSTTMTHFFPANEKDTTIQCLYSNYNFKSMSSLRVIDNYFIQQPNEGDRMQKNMTETNGHIITVPIELHTTVDLPCSCPISPELTVAVQWYRSSSPTVFRKDGKALASWYGEETGGSQGFGINDDFSMIIYSVNVTDEGVYRCIVTPSDGATECTHDVKVEIYANPDSSPVIEYIRKTNGFNVTAP